MKLLINSTSTALWHEIIHEAEASCDIPLKEELESYLVFLMMRYTARPEIVQDVMASDFLKGLPKMPNQRHLILQGVGDKCLLFSGLFPNLAEKRLVKVSYFVNLGQSSYATISQEQGDLYSHLSGQFVALMDILQSVRQYSDEFPDLLPLQAYELWNETGSKRALSVLKQYTKATPLNVDVKKQKLYLIK